MISGRLPHRVENFHEKPSRNVRVGRMNFPSPVRPRGGTYTQKGLIRLENAKAKEHRREKTQKTLYRLKSTAMFFPENLGSSVLGQVDLKSRASRGNPIKTVPSLNSFGKLKLICRSVVLK